MERRRHVAGRGLRVARRPARRRCSAAPPPRPIHEGRPARLRPRRLSRQRRRRRAPGLRARPWPAPPPRAPASAPSPAGPRRSRPAAACPPGAGAGREAESPQVSGVAGPGPPRGEVGGGEGRLQLGYRPSPLPAPPAGGQTRRNSVPPARERRVTPGPLARPCGTEAELRSRRRSAARVPAREAPPEAASPSRPQAWGRGPGT